jgi:hypothetical protein
VSEQSNQMQENKPLYRKVTATNGITWLKNAYWLFKYRANIWLMMMLFMLILFAVPVIQFFSIIFTPLFTASIMLGCVNIRQNKGFKFSQLFYCFSHSTKKLINIGLIYFATTFGCLILALKISDAMGYTIMPFTQEMLNMANSDPERFMALIGEQLLMPMLIFMALMVPVLMANWFAPTLIVLNKLSVIESLKQSFKACRTNMKAFTIYGLAALIVIMTLALAVALLVAFLPSLSIFLKLLFNLVIMSLTFATMFSSYEDIFISSELEGDPADKNNTAQDDDEGPSSIIL